MASSLVTCTSSIASVLRRRASSSVALPSAYPLPGQVHAAVGIRQGDIHHAKVTPIKSRFLALDAVAHLRLWFECDHAARTSNRAHHPETINSLVCPDIQHGRAAQSEAHHCLDLQPFCSKAITQASNQKMCIVYECRSRDYIIHFVDSAESSSPSGDKLVMLRRIIRTITLEHMPLCFAPQKSRSVHRRRKETPWGASAIRITRGGGLSYLEIKNQCSSMRRSTLPRLARHGAPAPSGQEAQPAAAACKRDG
jgi:hypothetical protein